MMLELAMTCPSNFETSCWGTTPHFKQLQRRGVETFLHFEHSEIEFFIDSLQSKLGSNKNHIDM